MSGGIIRAPRDHTRDRMPRAALRDRALSYRARGILARLLTNENGFLMTAEDLAREGKEGRGAVLTALRELREVGYIKTARRQSADGRWTTETFVREETNTEGGFSDAGFSNAGSLDSKSSKGNKATQEKKKQEKGACAPDQQGTRLPDGWVPPDELLTWAAATNPMVDLVEETAKFCDYWQSMPGARGRKLDWTKTWRNWIRNARPAIPTGPRALRVLRGTAAAPVKSKTLQAFEAIEAEFVSPRRQEDLDDFIEG